MKLISTCSIQSSRSICHSNWKSTRINSSNSSDTFKQLKERDSDMQSTCTTTTTCPSKGPRSSQGHPERQATKKICFLILNLDHPAQEVLVWLEGSNFLNMTFIPPTDTSTVGNNSVWQKILFWFSGPEDNVKFPPTPLLHTGKESHFCTFSIA